MNTYVFTCQFTCQCWSNTKYENNLNWIRNIKMEIRTSRYSQRGVKNSEMWQTRCFSSSNKVTLFPFPVSSANNKDRIARHLHKRATVDPRKTTCMLYLQADHQFFARYGTEEACIEVMTRHVQRVNSIYKHTGECSSLQRYITRSHRRMI